MVDWGAADLEVLLDVLVDYQPAGERILQLGLGLRLTPKLGLELALGYGLELGLGLGLGL